MALQSIPLYKVKTKDNRLSVQRTVDKQFYLSIHNIGKGALKAYFTGEQLPLKNFNDEPWMCQIVRDGLTFGDKPHVIVEQARLIFFQAAF